MGEIVRIHENLGLETTDLTGGSGRLFGRSAADDASHDRINRQAFGVIGVFVTVMMRARSAGGNGESALADP